MQRENLTVLVRHWQDTALPLPEDSSMTLAHEEQPGDARRDGQAFPSNLSARQLTEIMPLPFSLLPAAVQRSTDTRFYSRQALPNKKQQS